MFIGVKDLDTPKRAVSRYRNKIHSKYENVLIYGFKDEVIANIKNGKRNFRAIDWYPSYIGPREYKPNEYQALIVDMEDNFKMFVEFTHEEVKLYKEIKNAYKREDLKDSDKLIVKYFKVLEYFDS